MLSIATPAKIQLSNERLCASKHSIKEWDPLGAVWRKYARIRGAAFQGSVEPLQID